MSKIKNLLILEHFTNNQFNTPHTFGKYWFEFKGEGKILVIRQNDEWKAVSNYIDTPIKDCLGNIRENVIHELEIEIERQINKEKKYCGICNAEVEHLNELKLDGTDDIYNLELCDECYDLYSSDYFAPEEIEDLFNNN